MATSPWYDYSWQYRKKITIDHTKVPNADQSNFPVLLSLTTDSNLASHAQANGNDILFTQSDKVTKIPHEIENYNGTTGKLVAWVNVPNVSSSTDTDIYMYYGNSGASNQQQPTLVWDGNYKMVQHLKETTDGTAGAIKDSTSNNNNGTDNNGPTLGATGQIDGAISFDGTDDSIDCGDLNEVGDVPVLTFEAWAEPLTGVDGAIISKYTGMTHRTHIYIQGTTIYWNISNSASSYAISSVTLNTWHHFAMVFDGSQINNDSKLKCYLDGELQLLSFPDSPIPATAFFAGNLALGKQDTHFFNGTIDEVRISDIARSSDWIKTSYNNQNNPSSFFSLDSEESAPVAPAVIGGVVFTVNKAAVLAPWLLLATAVSVVIIQIGLYFRKKMTSRHPMKKSR